MQGLNDKRATILRLARMHGAGNVRVFGSVVRGTDSSTSDLDLLVSMEPGRSLLDLIGLALDLEDELGLPVDVVSDRGLSPHLRESILSEAVAL